MAFLLDTKANKIKQFILANNDFFDIKTILAEHASKLLFGQGIRITSENKKVENYLQELLSEQEIDDLLLQVARDVSYFGYSLITIDRTAANKLILGHISGELYQNVVEFESTPLSARFLRKRVLGNRVYFITEIWTTTKVKRSIQIQTAKDKAPREINLETDGLVPKEFDLPIEEKHNLGFVPYVLITNKPRRNFLLHQHATELQDDASVSSIAGFINTNYQRWFTELFKGGSKVFGNFTPTDKAKLKEQSSDPTFDDFLIQAHAQGTTGTTKLVEIMPASYNQDPWANSIKSNINLYFFGAGYAIPFPEIKDPSVAESLYSRDNDTKTTKEKRRMYQGVLDNLIAKLLVYNKMAKDIKSARELFVLEIKENVIYNEQQLGELLVNNVLNGLMTRAEAIAKMRDIPIKDAEEIVRKIEKENAEDRNNMAAFQQSLTSNENGQSGAPNDLPRGEPDKNAATESETRERGEK